MTPRCDCGASGQLPGFWSWEAGIVNVGLQRGVALAQHSERIAVGHTLTESSISSMSEGSQPSGRVITTVKACIPGKLATISDRVKRGSSLPRRYLTTSDRRGYAGLESEVPMRFCSCLVCSVNALLAVDLANAGDEVSALYYASKVTVLSDVPADSYYADAWSPSVDLGGN